MTGAGARIIAGLLLCAGALAPAAAQPVKAIHAAARNVAMAVSRRTRERSRPARTPDQKIAPGKPAATSTVRAMNRLRRTGDDVGSDATMTDLGI